MTQSAVDTPEDSCKRLVQCAFFGILQYDLCKARFKKPFNPILGETYEYVSDELRIITEQVSHHPPISACHI
jgi:oxysterol-binding protein 1